jgi:hypothetical protein
MQTNPTALRRAAIATAGAAIAYLLIRHVIASWSGVDRPLDADEIEYLHAGWLLRQGLRLYRDFAEDHAPFLFVILKWMVPAHGTAAFPRLDLVTYVARARIFVSACGILGLGAAAVVAYRATKSLIAPLVTIAAILASPWMWFRAIIQVRNDPPALFLFWIGALLLLVRWRSERLRAACAGVGIGLVAVAALWNPKWPLESLVLGAVYLIAVRRAFDRGAGMLALVLLPPIACGTAALACIGATTTFGDYVFFTFRFNKVLTDWTAANPYLTKLTEKAFHTGRAYMFCSTAFKGVWPIAAVVLALLFLMPAIRRRIGTFDVNTNVVLIALVAAATIEIRFLYAYPNIWTQYYVMWSFIAACLYGTTAAAVIQLIPRDWMRLGATIAIALISIVTVELALPVSGGANGWPSASYLQRNLRPGETVWMDHHPIGVPDATYYWFAPNDLIPCAIDLAARNPGKTPLPQIGERDLPMCRAERGLQPDLRFVSGLKWIRVLPESRRCFDRLVATGRAVRTPVSDVWDLHPNRP